MKNLFILSMLLSFSFNGFGQGNPVLENGNYYINPKRNWSEINIDNKKEFKGKRYILNVKSVTTDKVYAQFWKFSKNSINKIINGDKNSKIYEMSIDDFKNMTSVYYNRVDWRVGTLIVPLKLRFNDFEFTSNVNIGTSINAKIRYDRTKKDGFSIEPSFGISAGGIDLDTSNSLATNPTNVFAFSLSTGAVFHFTKSVNFGILFGVDKLSGKDQKQYNWNHDGKVWLGLGINVNFADKNKSNGKATSQQ